nr:MAG TPA: hypothetical protein [Bacteriophage sp.]
MTKIFNCLGFPNSWQFEQNLPILPSFLNLR